MEDGADPDLPFGSKSSNLASRCAMYFNSWITGGRLLACITLPAARYSGFTNRVLQETNEDDARQDFAKKGYAVPRQREIEFHRFLDKTIGIKRVRSERSEWFEGNLDLMKKALRSVGGTFYEFKNNQVTRGQFIYRDNTDVTNILNRHTPRIKEEICENKSDRAKAIRLKMSRQEIIALCGGQANKQVLAKAINKIVTATKEPILTRSKAREIIDLDAPPETRARAAIKIVKNIPLRRSARLKK